MLTSSDYFCQRWAGVMWSCLSWIAVTVPVLLSLSQYVFLVGAFQFLRRPFLGPLIVGKFPFWTDSMFWPFHHLYMFRSGLCFSGLFLIKTQNFLPFSDILDSSSYFISLFKASFSPLAPKSRKMSRLISNFLRFSLLFYKNIFTLTIFDIWHC